jgi:hypothetical protein
MSILRIKSNKDKKKSKLKENGKKNRGVVTGKYETIDEKFVEQKKIHN